jgi:acetyltransferase-like isoleucine patch superfamily enzyme
MCSDRCYIGDCYHGYDEKDVAIIDQYLFSPGPIRIGDGSWLGIGVAVLPGVTIGRNCIIGANAVVKTDVPDHHIAAGNPARIVREIGS